MKFSWSLSADGSVLESGTLDLPAIEPTKKHYLKLNSGPWASRWKEAEANEIFLDITAYLSAPTRWADAGHVLASEQMELPVSKHAQRQVFIFFLVLLWHTRVNLCKCVTSIQVK